MDAEEELISLGEGALPVLEQILSGAAKNRYGVPYRKLGLPLRCALEVARRMGPVVKPLEHMLRTELAGAYGFVSAMALGSLTSLDEASIVELAAHLDGHTDLAWEAAAALIRCGALDHVAVQMAAERSNLVSYTLRRVGEFLARSPA